MISDYPKGKNEIRLHLGSLFTTVIFTRSINKFYFVKTEYKKTNIMTQSDAHHKTNLYIK